ncbi:MAG: flagellar filament capping protein FliD [Dehalococcoidia bacterium]
MVSGTPSITGSGKIAFGGSASGIDTSALIDALIVAESRPITLAQQRLQKEQTRQSALGTLSSSLASLTSVAAALKDASVVGAKVASTNQVSGQPQSLTVSASSSASVGSFTVDVLGLATSTRVQSTGALGQAVTQNVALADAGFTTAVTTGTFTVNGVAITIDDNTVLSDGSDLTGANTIIAKINDAGVGVTASITNDGDGRANLVQLTSGAAIALGAGGDTSNFLAAANLLQSPGTTTRTSTRSIAGVSTSAALEDSRLATAISTATGSFTVNGVTVEWDRTSDSLANVVSKINSAGAGVTASFDVLTDRLVLTSTTTGSSAITLADVSGNFLAATGVLAATQTTGQNASYKINSGTTQYASTNTVTDAVSGVTLSLLDTTASAITVTISADNTTLRSRLQNFVTQYNSTAKLISDATKYDGENGTSGPLFGDPALQRIQQSMRTMITSAATGLTGNLTTLSSIGLSFGAVGSAVGTTTTLTLDSAKFSAALASNPDGVAKLLTAFKASASLNGGGGGSIASISGTPPTVPDSGRYTIASSVSGALTVTYYPDNGSGMVVSTGSITAGGTNTTIIPGVTITAKPVLVDGTDTITIGTVEKGAGRALADYLGGVTASGGPIASGVDGSQQTVTDINAQIKKLQARVDAKRAALERKFATLETTMAQLQQQKASLTQLQNSMNSSNK